MQLGIGLRARSDSRDDEATLRELPDRQDRPSADDEVK